MTVAMSDMVEKVRQEFQTLTNLKLGSTVSVRKDKNGWHVQVEALEKASIPDSQDILANYELNADEDGNVVDFARIGLRRRNDATASENTGGGL